MQKINFLVLGGGAREHAIAQKLSESSVLGKLYLADSNDGFCDLGDKIQYENYEDLAKKAVQKGVDILVVGPENPLCDGIADMFKRHDIGVIGVDKNWSRLESSKYFAKKFMEKHDIKTAKYKYIKDFAEIDSLSSPFVIKADGLCKGKGVAIVESLQAAKEVVCEYLNGKFGEASKSILVEEFLEGEEFSLMSLWDSKNLVSFLPARDFKRINADPLSPNTGGMGAFCPVKLTAAQSERLKEYEKRLWGALYAEKADFTGFIYSGLVWHDEDFYVLEYNVRLGDPETQAILTHLDSDLGEMFFSAIKQTLGEKFPEEKLRWKPGYSVSLVIAAETYPQSSSYGEKISNCPDKGIYFAGVKKEAGELFTNGGRILSVCVHGATAPCAFDEAKTIADGIEFKGKYYRTDL